MYFHVPETKGKTLEEIQHLFRTFGDIATEASVSRSLATEESAYSVHVDEVGSDYTDAHGYGASLLNPTDDDRI